MSQTQQQQGTTLAMIAAYGAYKPIFRTEDGDFALISIDFEAGEIGGLVLDGGDMTYTYKVDEATLLLRPFAALGEPLSDGTVPARRVAELLLDVPDCFDQAEWDWDELNAEVDDDQGLLHLTVQLFDKQAGTDCLIYLWQDGTIQVHNGPHSKHLAVFDYLRANHFASSVNGRLLVEGVDYIAK